MSSIANKRKLMAATQAFIKKSAPEAGDFKAVCDCLAQVISDEIGADCKLVLKVSLPDAVRKATGGTAPKS